MTIKHIKDSIIGLCLIDKNNNIVSVGGSGIVIHPKGYFLTATHVIIGLGKKTKRDCKT